MISAYDIQNYEQININVEWNNSVNKEKTMHSIHPYPAKFPAFIASKAFDYAINSGVEVKQVADVFCGCGTVALESKLHSFNFWGCDINPVATLIAKAKSENYDITVIDKYYNDVILFFKKLHIDTNIYEKANERLKYWFTESNYTQLYKLKYSIEEILPNGKYRDAFFCIFSSILKSCSKWLSKSIKPQVDPNKKEVIITNIFERQFNKFRKAILEANNNVESDITIICDNFLTVDILPNVDLVITSPPYVTSYEYADLHQLSSLWLGYTDDYRSLRSGSIGSIYNSDSFLIDMNKLNITGRNIVNQLLRKSKINSRIKSVARSYVDIQHAIKRCHDILNVNGMAFFVVGDTEQKGVKIENSKHLIECLLNNGFDDVKIGKRKISNKLLTPYRDYSGKFSTDKTQRTIYHEEYIISGRKYK